MKNAFIILCIISCFAANTIPRYITWVDGDLFCKWQAISFVILTMGIVTATTGKVQIIAFWLTGMAGNNVYNEWYGKPFQPGDVEIQFAIFITLVTLCLLYSNQLLTLYNLIICYAKRRRKSME